MLGPQIYSSFLFIFASACGLYRHFLSGLLNEQKAKLMMNKQVNNVDLSKWLPSVGLSFIICAVKELSK